MNKLKYFFVILTIAIFLVLIFYNIILEDSNNVEPSLDQNVSIYSLIFDAIIKQDEGLNSEMKYISIDSNSTKDLTEEEREEILEYLKIYNVDIINYSFEELKEKGMFNEETLSLEGILLEIKTVKKITKNDIVVEAVKYRSGLGAIGMEYTLQFKNNEWTIKEEKMLWIS